MHTEPGAVLQVGARLGGPVVPVAQVLHADVGEVVVVEGGQHQVLDLRQDADVVAVDPGPARAAPLPGGEADVVQPEGALALVYQSLYYDPLVRLLEAREVHRIVVPRLAGNVTVVVAAE